MGTCKNGGGSKLNFNSPFVILIIFILMAIIVGGRFFY